MDPFSLISGGAGGISGSSSAASSGEAFQTDNVFTVTSGGGKSSKELMIIGGVALVGLYLVFGRR